MVRWRGVSALAQCATIGDSVSATTEAVGTCGAKRRRGGPCTKPAGWGTDHQGIGQCKLHGGSTPNANKNAAVKIAQSMGEAIDIQPHEALLACVQITAGEVAYCTLRIQELKTEEYTGHPEAYIEESWGDGGKQVTKQLPVQLNIWIVARRDAMDRLARYAKMALDAGVEERRVRLAEGMAAQLAPVLDAIMRELELTPKQKEKAPAIVERNLLTLEGPAAFEVNGAG
jgi:hypothetical protein